MDELDRDGTFAYRGGDALGRPVSHVACGEDAGEAGLQQHRRTLERPAGGVRPGAVEVSPGEHETMIVPLDALAGPPGVWLGSDHHEQRRGRRDIDRMAVAVAQSQGFHSEPGYIGLDTYDVRRQRVVSHVSVYRIPTVS
jgi:hypothetical protein